MMAWRFRFRLRFDLHFITTPQIDTAVCILAAIEFDVQLEILELRIADQLRTVSGADQASILNRPLRRTRLAHLPTGQVFSVEELNGLSPFRRATSFKCRSPFTNPLPSLSVRSIYRTGQGFADQLAFKHHVALTVFFFLWRDEGQSAIRDFNLGERSRISPSTNHPRFQLAILLLDLQP